MRKEIVQFLGQLITRYPTISLNSGVKFADEVANYVANLSNKTKKNFEFDISRQAVSKSIFAHGKEIFESTKKIFFENYDQSCVILDHWSSHGRSFIGIIARMFIDDEIIEKLVEFKEASVDKSSLGIFTDFESFVRKSGFPLPIITDNCRTMIGLSKQSKFIFKIFCLEHKLAIIESKIHKNIMFKKIDDKITLINSFFSYRHGKYNLPLKPPNSVSQTRPWRSNKLNYSIFIANNDSYLRISAAEPNFPDIPSLFEVEQLSSFENSFCANFDLLETKTSDMLKGIEVYFNLIILARDDQFAFLNLEQIIIDELYPIVFSPIACAFYFLSKTNFESKCVLLSYLIYIYY